MIFASPSPYWLLPHHNQIAENRDKAAVSGGLPQAQIFAQLFSRWPVCSSLGLGHAQVVSENLLGPFACLLLGSLS